MSDPEASARVLVFLFTAIGVVALLAAFFAVMALLLRYVWVWLAVAFGLPPIPFGVAYAACVFLFLVFGGPSSPGSKSS